MTALLSARKLFSLLMIVVLGFSSLVTARPLPSNPLIQTEEKRKLPPVNWIRSRDIDVKHVAIDLRFDWDKDSAYGSTTVTLSPFAVTNKVSLDAASMTVNSVSLANGAALKFNYNEKAENDNLEIFLDKFYKRGEDVAVKIDYKTNYVNTADAETAIGSFGRGLRFIKPTADEPSKPKQIWSQGETEFNRYWFPSYDTPNDFRTTELRATVAKPFSVVSNGKLVSTTENTDGTRTFYWKMDTPYSNYLTSIVVGEFAPVEQNYDGIPIVNYGYPNETKEVAATVKNLPDMVKFFSEKTGVRYPYPKYAQTMVEDFGGGMENISATTQIEEMIHDEREMLDEDSDSLQAHELAHQWFGDLVTCRDWGQIWLNESFATYMDALYHEHSKGHEDFLYSNIRDNQNQYFNTWNQGNRHPIVTKYYANKDAMFDTYAYPRGAAVLHMLRKHLGDELFWKSLDHYLTSNMNQPVSTEELRIAIEETSGQSMDWFFDEWLYKMGHPIFDVTQSYDDAGKKLTLNVKQTQKIDPNDEFPQVEFFQTYVDIEIDDKVERVWLKPQAENVFIFDAAAKPKLVNFDFEGTLIKQITFEKSIDDLIYQMLNDKDVLGKRWAMGELEKKASVPADKPRIITALVTSMEKDKFWRLRRAALSVIANLYSPDPPPGADRPAAKLDEPVLQAVLRMTKDANSLVRGDALELIGETRDVKYADTFIASLNDQSYSVIDQSALALGRVKGPKAFDALAKLTTGSSWRGRVETAGLTGLAELGDKKAFEPAFKLATDKSRPLSVRLAALAVVGTTGKGDPRAYPIIFEKFKTALDANDFNDLIRGIEAIIRLADPRGQEAFDLMKARFKDQPQLLGGVAFFEQQFKAALKK
jgi:aminopeptidase N